MRAVTNPLTPGERAAWRAVLLVADLLRFEVAAEVGPVTGLSPADHSVLMRLDETPGRQVGQQNLANAMFWSKSRLSRQLSRMQTRGLVERTTDGSPPGVRVSMTEAGRSAIRAAAGVHAAAVRRHLIQVASEEELNAFVQLADRIADRDVEKPR
jgi:DNA-binding MarR family transcriptional regulator